MRNKPQKMLALLLSAGMAVSTLSLSALADTPEDSTLVNTDENQVIEFQGTVVTDEEGNIIDILDADGNSMSNIPLGPDVEIVPGDGGAVADMGEGNADFDSAVADMDESAVFDENSIVNDNGTNGFDENAGIALATYEAPSTGEGKVTLTVEPGVEVQALYYNPATKQWEERELKVEDDGKLVFFEKDFVCQGGEYGTAHNGFVLFLCKPEAGSLLTGIRGDNTTGGDKKGDRYLLDELKGSNKDNTELNLYPNMDNIIEQYKGLGFQAAFGFSRYKWNKGTSEQNKATYMDTTADLQGAKPVLKVESTVVEDKEKFEVGEVVHFKVTATPSEIAGARQEVLNLTIKVGDESYQVIRNGQQVTQPGITPHYKTVNGQQVLDYYEVEHTMTSAGDVKVTGNADVEYTYSVEITNSYKDENGNIINGVYSSATVYDMSPTGAVATVVTNPTIPEEDEGTTPPPTFEEYFTNSTPPVTTPPTTPTTPPTEETVIEDEETPLGELPELPELPEEVEILDEETPLGEIPEELEISDEEIPLGQLPQTGAEWAPAVALGALGLGLCATGAVTLKKKEDA